MNVIHSIVGILDKNDQIIGTGFITSDVAILTCAHVIQAAGGEPGGQVKVRFASDESVSVASVDAGSWSPAEEQDVALLRIQGKPASAERLSLGMAAGAQGHTFRAYGYASVGGLQGVGARGEIIEIVNQGKLLQITSQEIDRGFSGGPIIDEASRAVVGMVTWGKISTTSQRHRDTTFAVTSEAIREICPELALSEVPPYRSLDSFTEADADFFFGRERVIQRLLDSLKREPRFLAVLGPSGSGKSSIIKAGLIPAIKEGSLTGSEKWGLLSIRPQSQPFEQLAGVGLDGPDQDLAASVKKWLTSHAEYSRLVLVIDQFEELLVNVPKDIQTRFIEELAGLLDSSLAVSVVLVMRDDFYSQFQHEATLLTLWLEHGLVNIPPVLDAEELQAIVTRPAKAVGLDFEDGLVEVILADARATDQSGKIVRSTILPLLEFALTQLWEHRQDGRLTHEAYRKIGGVTGGLSQWADRAYYSLDVTERDAARYLLGELVHPGEEEHYAPDTRQVKVVEDISRDPLTRKVLQNLVQARLLSTGRDELKGVDTVEIIHEALLFEWGLLKKWLDEDREFLTWRDHLREEIERWKGSGKSKDALLSGLPLNQAETWMKNRARELNVEEKDFITRGIQRRERGRRLTITSVAAAMLVITAILIGWVISSTRSADKLEVQVVAAQTAQGAAEAAQSMAEVALSESEKQRQIALSNQLAAQAQLELAGGRPERGVLLALEALETLPYTSQAELALGTAVMESRGRLILSGHTGRVYSAAWSPDEKFIVSAGADGTARIWEVASGKEITALEHPDEVNDVAWSLDGSSILTACEDGIARVWDSESGELLLELSAHRSPVHSAAWSPDGSMIVTASGQVCGNGCAEDTLVRIWSARSGSLLGEFSGHSSTVNDAAWSPDGELIVSVSGDAYTNDRSARIWRVSTMEELVVIKGYLGEVTSADWSPDGGVIVTGQFNGPVRVLDAQTGGELFSLEGHTDIKWSADWSPDGNRIASTSRDRTIRIWDTFNGEEQLQLLGHSDGVNHVEWSPSGNRIVTTSDDGTVRIWDAAPWPELMRLPGMAVASWSPDGKQIAVREEQMWNAYVWEVGNGREQFSLSTRTNALDELDWSPDGSRLATLGWDPGVPAADLSIWDAESGDKLMTMNGHTFFVSALDWSPDGKQIVTTSPDKTAIIWDVESGSQIMTIEHPDEVLGVAWSPNGDRFATTGLDGIGRIWEATTGKELLTFNGAIGQIVWSSDGRSILGAGENDTAIVWNADTGEQILRLEGHTGEINDVAWSPNGDRIVTASRDKTARIWDASTGDLLLILDGNYTIVSTIAWSPDGTRLITSSWDGAIKIWRVWQTTEDLLSYAHACCDIRELDEQERQQFNLP